MKSIVAVDRNWGIGRNNDLLFRLPADMRFFRAATLNKVVVMGSNTLLSFPGGKPLADRINVVLWPGGAKRGDCIVADSPEELKAILSAYPSDDIYVVGGAMFYRFMLPYCDTVLATKVDADGGAEVFYEDLDAHPDWECVRTGEATETNGFAIRFCEYRNKNLKDFFGGNDD